MSSASGLSTRSNTFHTPCSYSGTPSNTAERSNSCRAAAVSLGLLPTAIEDALFRGRQVFTLDQDGEAVLQDESGQDESGQDESGQDESGQALPGADGEPRLTPAQWLEGMRQTAPHWWPHSSGANAPGALNGGEVALGYDQAGVLSPERYVQLRREGRIS